MHIWIGFRSFTFDRWAIVGLTEQLLHEKIDRWEVLPTEELLWVKCLSISSLRRERYVTDMHQLQPEVLRHNRRYTKFLSPKRGSIYWQYLLCSWLETNIWSLSSHTFQHSAMVSNAGFHMGEDIPPHPHPHSPQLSFPSKVWDQEVPPYSMLARLKPNKFNLLRQKWL